jgi:arsenate reductase
MRRILFVCWGNCVRSQLAEVLLNFRGARRFEARSAGARPAGFVHALTLEVLQEMGLRPRGLESKHWDGLREERFDAIVVLDPQAREELDLPERERLARIGLDPQAREELGAQWPPSVDDGALPAARGKSGADWPATVHSAAPAIRVYWEVGDPIGEHGRGRALTREEQREAFRRARDEIREDIERLVIAPAEVIDDDAAFGRLLREIGE